MPQTVGFIGLGIMGRPMARNLLRAGFRLVVHNRSRGPVEELVTQGALDGRSACGVAEAAEVVITMLPDTPDVRAVVLGPDGVLEGLRRGAIYVDMSTISPVATRELAEAVRAQGAVMLDAPVSGGEKGAIEGTLSIMVGGPEEAFREVLPVFQAMGKNIVRIGEVGAGQVAKACNQIVVAVTIQAVSEALTLARKAGVDPGRVREALLGGFAQSRILDLHGQRILERNFQPGFRARLHHKDLGIALETGKATGTPLWATALVHEIFGALRTRGMGDLDHSAVARLVEELAGLGDAGPQGVH
ncbi:MAG: 2-hydroxy-3-oxopropionate reductase [Armatimonadota bacterium]|nr:2-hydroxy-3-oxopropionate reductase [Armatimonadota bacterium]MDR7448482.1 2-hydroxy-3-oxopropionate reductase [Armatimonadota bacterium]MDR7459374.1 2-hydroxy-3-oxopropionate reductase [Armatimonadota bacterium]MDR7479433.1 2-hydroxy-3-oxopropionate reductase [Armatimonadota bacterium]MDR7487475.1 2-hydroxy-3-oxopropionate reductase [Armatimonadota bacterium]